MANNQSLFNKKLDSLVYIIEQPDVIVNDEEAEVTQIILDATTDYSKKVTARVSTNPVGDKSDVSDHYRVMPHTLSFSGVISNDVVKFYPWLSSGESANRAQEYVEKIEKIIAKKSLVTCYMPDGLMTTDCLITSFTARRDVSWSNGFNVEMTLQRITTLTGSVSSKPSDDTADSLSGTSNNGSKTTTTAKESDRTVYLESQYNMETNVSVK